MTLVVDASVATKWLLPEPASADAATLRARDSDLIAPSLVIAEIGNALWKSAMRGDTIGEHVSHYLDVAVGHYARLIPIADIATAAMKFSIDLKHPIYDCFYLALAEREACTLISADSRLLAAAKRVKAIEVRAL